MNPLVKRAKELRTVHVFSSSQPSDETIKAIKEREGEVILKHHVEPRLGNYTMTQDNPIFNHRVLAAMPLIKRMNK